MLGLGHQYNSRLCRTGFSSSGTYGAVVVDKVFVEIDHHDEIKGQRSTETNGEEEDDVLRHACAQLRNLNAGKKKVNWFLSSF